MVAERELIKLHGASSAGSITELRREGKGSLAVGGGQLGLVWRFDEENAGTVAADLKQVQCAEGLLSGCSPVWMQSWWEHGRGANR
jgi:hypothetical protein